MIKQTRFAESKQIPKNQLQEVYQQILKKYDRETVIIQIKDTQNKQNPFSDDALLFKANKTLPKLEIDVHRKGKNQYYSNKLIVNQSVYISQRKKSPYQQFAKNSSPSNNAQKLNKNQFQKLDIPNVLKQKGILTERNKRIMELYRRVENDSQSKLSPIKISFVRRMSNQTSIFNQQKGQASNNDERFNSQQSEGLKMRPSDKKMITILKQVKDKRNKLQFPKMKSHRTRSSIIIQTLNDQSSPAKVLKCTKYINKPVSLNVINDEDDQKKMSINQEKEKKKNRNKTLMKFDPTKQILAMNLRRRKYNWKSQPIQIDKITKDQFFNLIRGYLRINTIQQINSGFYRAYLGTGNNVAVVKKTLKQRGCWTIVDSLDDDPHFVWTQFKLINFSDKLPQCSDNQVDTDMLSNFSMQIPRKQNQLASNQELKQFIRVKSNQYTQGCQKLVLNQIYLKLIFNIKQKFKNNSYLQHFRKLRFQVLECLSLIKQSRDIKNLQPIKANDLKLHNHVDGAGAIGDKKGLLHYMTRYTELFEQNINQLIPETIHIDSDNIQQLDIFEKLPEGPWILKPGEATNRGQGITIHITRQSLLTQLSKKKKHHQNPTIKYTNIVQRYIFPLLYNNRKFDIRIWVLWNSRAKQAWWYQQGYIRTSSKQFTLRNTNKFIHLTNDAIQSQSQDYGKFQPANKVSFNQFQKYLENQYGYKTFNESIIKQMKELAYKLFRIGNMVFDPLNKQNTFELFGLDFLIDNKFKPWLIQCNTNPCLETNCSLLTRLVPNMLDNLMNLTVDSYFPMPTKKKMRQSQQAWNHQGFKFQLLYDGIQDIQIKEVMLTKPDINITYKGQYEQQQTNQ